MPTRTRLLPTSYARSARSCCAPHISDGVARQTSHPCRQGASPCTTARGPFGKALSMFQLKAGDRVRCVKRERGGLIRHQVRAEWLRTDTTYSVKEIDRCA